MPRRRSIGYVASDEYWSRWFAYYVTCQHATRCTIPFGDHGVDVWDGFASEGCSTADLLSGGSYHSTNAFERWLPQGNCYYRGHRHGRRYSGHERYLQV